MKEPARDELDRAWAATTPLLPVATASFLVSHVAASLALTRSLALTEGIFIVLFAAVVLVVAVLERGERFTTPSARRTLIAIAALSGLVSAVLAALLG
ncbi:hypothetical protein CFH99_08620 [Nocardioides aromaticivorans]|uniref:Uncharacterized protein n=1 Tax=Nocardioides aromaticivorans TaxID=200618 RepID=A0ABX7PI80_9ACTN|nr:hypothetical protein CFH99_08620 [Nocardioides aromaticivorans]